MIAARPIGEPIVQHGPFVQNCHFSVGASVKKRNKSLFHWIPLKNQMVNAIQKKCHPLLRNFQSTANIPGNDIPTRNQGGYHGFSDGEKRF